MKLLETSVKSTVSILFSQDFISILFTGSCLLKLPRALRPGAESHSLPANITLHRTETDY